MAWQGLFIFIVSTFMRDYYFKEIYFFRDELEGTIGYIFLSVMVVTSFRFGRKFVNPMQWKLIHKGGIYFLWAYPFSVYWWNLAGTEPRFIDYLFYYSGLLAFVLRIAAWGKKRYQLRTRIMPGGNASMLNKVLGNGLILFGLFSSTTGFYWQQAITKSLTSTAWSAELELWLPFWPLEPYLALFVIGSGAMLLTNIRPQTYSVSEITG